MAVIELSDKNFEQTIASNNFVIVDFWAPWCAPCRSFAPVFESVSSMFENIVFGKVNTEQEHGIAAHFQVRSIPTLMIFRDQIIVFSQPGALPESAFRQLVVRASALDMNDVRKQLEAEKQ